MNNRQRIAMWVSVCLALLLAIPAAVKGCSIRILPFFEQSWQGLVLRWAMVASLIFLIVMHYRKAQAK